MVGGRFLTTFAGEQFALPDAVAALRRVRRGDETPPLTIGAADPLNLSGILIPGPRIAVSSTEALTLARGELTPAGKQPIRPDFAPA